VCRDSIKVERGSRVIIELTTQSKIDSQRLKATQGHRGVCKEGENQPPIDKKTKTAIKAHKIGGGRQFLVDRRGILCLVGSV
jgi:hypothetical protein